jgi:steroid delta-isomerase-like uncharacterized protein
MPPISHEAHEEFTQMIYTGFPDIQFKTEDMIAVEDKVVTRWTAQGTHAGTFMDIPATGKSIRMTGINIYRFVKGKVVEQWGEGNDLDMMQQLGVIPAPGQTGG